MKSQSQAELLRICISEADKFKGKPLFDVIVNRAKEKGLAGATVLRGLMGFGADSKLHSAKVLRLSEDLPVVIEIVDSPEKIEEFLPELDEMIKDGMVTVEKVRAIAYRRDTGKQ